MYWISQAGVNSHSTLHVNNALELNVNAIYEPNANIWLINNIHKENSLLPRRDKNKSTLEANGS